MAPNRAARRIAEKVERSNIQPTNNPGTNSTKTVSLHQALTEAVRQHSAGDLAAAESVYHSILRSVPDQPDARGMLGVLRHQQGKSEEGIALLKRARALDPNNPEIGSNFGGVLLDAGRIAESEEILRKVLSITAAHESARLNLLRLLQREKRAQDVLAVCREGTAACPDNFTFHKMLGEILLAERAFVEAEEVYHRCLEIDPSNAQSMNDLAICCRELGNFAEAEHWYREAIRHAPDAPIIRHNYGAFLLSLGRPDDAREHLARVLANNPDHWMTLTLMALNLIKMGRESEAIEALHQIAAANPDKANVWNDVGAQFMHIGKFVEAVEMFTRAAELDPEMVEARTNLGNAYMKQGRGYDAIREYERALKIRPRHLEAHVALCRVLGDVYRFDEANIYAHATVFLNNFTPKHFTNPLQIFQTTCDYEGVKELGSLWDICESVDSEYVINGMLQLLVLADTPETTRRLSRIVRRWGEAVEKAAAASPLPPKSRSAGRSKLRIGVLSSDLRQHSVSRFVLPLIEKYDRNRFEFFCYCPFRVDNDKIQARFIAAADKFALVDNLTERQIAQMIQDDDIDILFDLNGFTNGTRLPALAYRPAPVQISWLGFPFTSALKDLDYILVDEYLKPVGDGGLLEKPLAMPGSWVCFGEGINFDPIPIDPNPPMTRNSGITFGTLNGTYKYAPQVVKAWADVMKAVPNSRFLVVRPECGSLITCRNLAKAFSENGISSDRLYFINNRGKPQSHLSYYNEIDISLDTFPVTGGTTTVEAAWMGVPVVSLVGPAIHQRVSYAILKHCGLDECCADTAEEFVAKAVALADVEKLRELRGTMRSRLVNTTLARPDLFIENFQNTMEQVARTHGLR